MRIISGKARSIRLKTPAGLSTRPTAERTKEAVFSILGDRVMDSKFLDLFAGSGQIGLEAASRGAEQVVFVESDFSACVCIKQNLKTAKLEPICIVLKQKAAKALAQLKADAQQFDLIFLDPPWAEVNTIVKQHEMDLNQILNDSGMLIVESCEPIGVTSTLKVVRQYKYGAAHITLMQKNIEEDT